MNLSTEKIRELTKDMKNLDRQTFVKGQVFGIFEAETQKSLKNDMTNDKLIMKILKEGLIEDKEPNKQRSTLKLEETEGKENPSTDLIKQDVIENLEKSTLPSEDSVMIKINNEAIFDKELLQEIKNSFEKISKEF